MMESQKQGENGDDTDDGLAYSVLSAFETRT